MLKSVNEISFEGIKAPSVLSPTISATADGQKLFGFLGRGRSPTEKKNQRKSQKDLTNLMNSIEIGSDKIGYAEMLDVLRKLGFLPYLPDWIKMSNGQSA